MEIEEEIIEATAEKNALIVNEYISNMENEEEFSSLGFWKLKRRLFPFTGDPPMAKKDEIGNIITAPETIKNLYVDTYKDRLRNRSMKPELMDIFHLKSELWETRNENLKNIKSKPWEAEDIEAVLKSMKNNKSRDPNGMMNELFKEGFIGQDLREAPFSFSTVSKPLCLSPCL